MSKKYELTDMTRTVNGVKVRRIRALREIERADKDGLIVIRKGQLGGFIQAPKNLSQEGNCFVIGEAVVMDRAKVSGDALVISNAVVDGKARVQGRALVTDYARVGGKSLIYEDGYVYGRAKLEGRIEVGDTARVCGTAVLTGNVALFGDTKVAGSSRVHGTGSYGIVLCDSAGVTGKARLYGAFRLGGDTHVCANAVIDMPTKAGRISLYASGASLDRGAYVTKPADVLVIGPLGTRNAYTTFYLTAKKTIMVNCGCFTGTISAFEKRVRQHRAGTAHLDNYLAAITLAKQALKPH